MTVFHIVLFDCGLVCLDSIVITDLRRFLFNFLIGWRNRKFVNKLHKQQPLIQRITLAYLEPYLKQYVKEFRRYQKLYVLVLYTLVPQYVILIICNLVMGAKSMYVLAGFALIKLMIALVIRFQTDSSLVSRYRKKK